MFKGDLIKKSNGWSVIYSRPNVGKISEIALDQASINLIVMKYGSRIKFLPNMNFMIAEGCAVVKFEEQEKTKSSKLKEWIDEGWAVVQREEQEKQKASKKLRELYDTPLELKYNPPIIDNEPFDPFSTSEESTMKHLVSAYEEFSNLEQTNPNDIKDFVFHINALQRILGQRVLRRDYPNTFPTYK
jgi:hypothetical protein